MQSVVVEKFALLVPVRLIPEMVTVELPVLVMVTIIAVLVLPRSQEPKDRLEGTTVIVAEFGTPVPVREVDCGELVALPDTAILPLRAPESVGVKVTFAVQDPPTATTRLLVQVPLP